jgi:hypothetical protein
MARKRLQGVGDGLYAALKKLGLGDAARLARIAAHWRHIAGDALADRASPERFERGVLTLCVQSSTWQSELTYLVPELKQRLRPIEVVREIRVISGSSANRVFEATPPPPVDEAPVAAAGALIADPELREVFEQTMRRDRAHFAEAQRRE